MKLSFEVKVNSSVEKIWSYYADINQWCKWDEKIETVSVSNPIQKGDSAVLKMKGQPPVEIIFDEVIHNKTFVNSTFISHLGVKIIFGHYVNSINADCHLLIHTAEIDKNTDLTGQDLDMLKMIFTDIPDAVMRLKELCEK